MFGLFNNPEKTALNLYHDAIKPFMDNLLSMWELKTNERQLPASIWESIYLNSFFWHLCIFNLAFSQNRAVEPNDHLIAKLVLFNHLVPNNLKWLVEKNIDSVNKFRHDPDYNESLSLAWEEGANNGFDMVAFVFGKLEPETLLNSPHFIEANKKARKFIGNQIDESNILADPTYKDVMFSELVNILIFESDYFPF